MQITPTPNTLETEVVPVLSSAGDYYVDGIYDEVYGTHTNGPPNGMALDNNETVDSRTSLAEASYTASQWSTLLEQTTFSSKPTGWTDDHIDYYDSEFHEDVSGFMTGYLRCTQVDTSGSEEIRFSIDFGGSWDINSYVYIQFWDGSNYDVMTTLTEGSKSARTVTSTDAQYKRTDFHVQIYYWNDADSMSFDADNWKIEQRDTYTRYRFEAIYNFSGIDFDSYATEELVVDFNSVSSSETLEFWFESGDTSPDHLIVDNIAGNTDFVVNIHDWLTGPDCYVMIRDESRSNDAISSTWAIDRMYLRLTNSDPQTNGTPITEGLVDSDTILSEYNYVVTSLNVSDPDGYSNLDYVELSVYDDGRSTEYFRFLYNESNDSFQVTHNPHYVKFDITTSSVSKSGINIFLDFNYTLDMDCPRITNADYKLLVVDEDEAGLDSPYWYETNWSSENRLALSGNWGLFDGVGTFDRGSIDGTIIANGTLHYYGFENYHPLTEITTIIVECANVSTSPWTVLQYDDSTGFFSVDVVADDEVGIDTYSFEARVEGVNRLISTSTKTYISDRINCTSLSTPAFIIDSSHTGIMHVRLRYEYDNSNVVDGSYLLNDLSLEKQIDDLWRASHTPNELKNITYNIISQITPDAHGISEINMNEFSLTMYWEELNCYISPPTEQVILPGANASGIVIRAEYYFWEYHGFQVYSGTIHINDTTFILNDEGRLGYNVSSADGDDTWNVFTIFSSNSTFCVWAYPEPAPSWDQDPSTQIFEYLDSFQYQLNATVPSGVFLWWLDNDTYFQVNNTGFLTNSTTIPISTYNLRIFVNDSYGRTINTTFQVIIQDTTAPHWISPLGNLDYEYATDFLYGFNCSDPSGLDKWILNDTSYFDITNSGVIFNNTVVDVGVYWLEVTVNDTYDNDISFSFSISVSDTLPPEWIESPSEQPGEYGYHFYYDLNATDPSGIHTWTVNDTANFFITSTGEIQNKTWLDTGLYWILVTVNDTHNNNLSEVFLIHVYDTTAPEWIQEPQNQDIELGEALSYALLAEVLQEIDMWWVNDSKFVVTEDGSLQNNTPLSVGRYWIIVFLNDTWGRELNATIWVSVTDNTVPSWIQAPSEFESEFGSHLILQFSAFDLSTPLEWSVNDSYFHIDGTGKLTNQSKIPVGLYNLEIRVDDSEGNWNTTELHVLVEDTISPSWVEVPQDQVIELGTSFLMNLKAIDLSPLSSWSIEGSSLFDIDGSGVLSNNVVLPVGDYILTVMVSDIHGNQLSTTFSISVMDRTGPEWVEIPENQFIFADESLSYQLYVTDLSPIKLWMVNDSDHFAISDTGLLTTKGNLLPDTYIINITIYDQYDNHLSTVISITVREVPGLIPPWLLFLGIAGFGMGIVAVLAALHTKGLLKRFNPLSTNKGEDLETALDYLDMVQSEMEGHEDST